MYYINENEVSKYLNMKETIDILEDVFNEYRLGRAVSDARLRTMIDGKILNSMPAIISKYNIAGLKSYFASREGAKFVVLVFDTTENELIATIEADKLGQIRTGALTAMVSRKIVKEKNPIITIVGSGYQAETQLEGLINVYKPEEIRVYSRNFRNAQNFAERMMKRFDISINVFKNVGEAVMDARIINTITNSNEPIFTASDIGEKCHINLAGANLPFRREVSKDVLEASDLIIVEHLEQSLKESREIIDFVSANGNKKIIELKDFMGYDSREDLKKTVFKSMGIGLEDLAASYLILKKMGLLNKLS